MQKKRVTAFITTTGTLLYVRMTEGNAIVHLTTDKAFDVYVHVRKEVPDFCRLYGTRRELEQELERQNFFIGG